MNNKRPPKAVYPHVRKYMKDNQLKEYSESGLNFIEHASVQILSSFCSKEGFKAESHMDTAVKTAVLGAETLYGYLNRERNQTNSSDSF